MKYRLDLDEKWRFKWGLAFPKRALDPFKITSSCESQIRRSSQSVSRIERSGGVEYPFTDLRSAIEKADDITAHSSSETQSVTIYLSKEPHFIVLSTISTDLEGSQRK